MIGHVTKGAIPVDLLAQIARNVVICQLLSVATEASIESRPERLLCHCMRHDMPPQLPADVLGLAAFQATSASAEAAGNRCDTGAKIFYFSNTVSYREKRVRSQVNFQITLTVFFYSSFIDMAPAIDFGKHIESDLRVVHNAGFNFKRFEFSVLRVNMVLKAALLG